jgi:MFS family permease
VVGVLVCHASRRETEAAVSDKPDLTPLSPPGTPVVSVDPLAEPVVRVRPGFIAVLALANLGIWTAFFTPIQFLLPLQVEGLTPGSKETSLSLVLTLGALVSLVSNPLAGALSDRTGSRLGRRRPWVLWSSIAAVAALVVLPLAPVVGALALGWALAQLTLNASYAAVTAIIPDQVPVGQRGTVSAVVGAAQPLGVMVGAIIVAVIPQTGVEIGSDEVGGQGPRYMAVAVVLALTAALFVWRMRDTPLERARIPPLQWGPFVRGFWVDPRQHPDFGWVWITRFLVVLGNAFVTTYLLFFARDVLDLPPTEADTTVAGILTYYIGALLIFALVTGPLSDRVGKVRVFVMIASFIIAAALVILAFSRDVGMVTIAAVVMGAGFGAYTAVDLALISRVLPRPEDRAKDLGVVNIANALPQVLAPVVAGVVVTLLRPAGYDVAYQSLYLAGAALTVLGAVLVMRIKSVP